jgi:hypothetical protein
MQLLDRSRFDHIGLLTEEPREGEVWVEAARAWVTSPRAHPANVEWVRFAPDSPVTGPVRTQPHLAYRVTDVRRAIEGHNIVAEPFEIGNGFATIAFVDIDGALIEFMQYANPNEEGWF